MPCLCLMDGYRSRIVNPKTGRRKLVFNIRDTDEPDVVFKVPKRTCKSCLLKRSRERAVRCVHEAKAHVRNCFITLTYSDEYLPANKSIDPLRTQKFMKDLRAFAEYHEDIVGIRSFGCGEYGGKKERPHYHILLFNYDFWDRRFWKFSKSRESMYRSTSLEKLWPEGYSVVQDLTFKSASYVARYCLKKQKVVKVLEKDFRYRVISRGPRKGMTVKVPVGRKLPDGRLAERALAVSLKPGIGKVWFDRYFKDWYPSDVVVLDGREMRPPAYYDRLYERMFPDEFEDVKQARIRAFKDKEEIRGSRAVVIDKHVQLSQLGKLKRSLEDDLEDV